MLEHISSESTLDPARAAAHAPGAAARLVPRIIHQVFPGNLPPLIQDNIDKIKSMNPDWDYRLYDDADMVDYIAREYGAPTLGAYHRINKKYGASRADFFRYLLMYRQGGVYLDIKSSLDKPLDQVIRPDDAYLLSRWRNGNGEAYEGWGKHHQLKSMGGNEFQQWHIIAAPEHPFLGAVIERVRRNIDTYNPVLHDTGRNGVLRMTGPIAYTQSIVPILHLHGHRIVDVQGDMGFKYSIFGVPGDRAHKAIFKFHYTELKEPVAHLEGVRKLVWMVFGPVRNVLIQPIRDFFDALARRLAMKAARRRQPRPGLR